MGRILLFYKYVEIAETGALKKWQQQLCKKLELTGRIILAHEGINGTVGGTVENTEAYINAMNAHPLFGNIDWKSSDGDSRHFPRMRIVIKDEIVRLDAPIKLTTKQGGKHLSPEEAHALMEEAPEDLVILDTRNNYECRIGTFKNAIHPDNNTFREFPKYVDEHLDQFKGKKVLMACTGGVRCELASGYLKEKGIAAEVYQIDGGIVRYTEKYPDGHFRGSNYVFDANISKKINDDILSHCDLCPTPCDVYLNCKNARCNKKFLCCRDCFFKFKETCSQECFDLVEAGKVNVRVKPARVDELYR